MLFHDAQTLFLKLSFLFNPTNLSIQIPSESRETVRITLPTELCNKEQPVASIQYGGVKYPMDDREQVTYTNIELRIKGQFLKSIGKYEEILTILKETDANNWVKYKFTDSEEDFLFAIQVRDIIIEGLEQTYGLGYLTLGMPQEIFVEERY